jgi:hypothetical protein
LRVSPASRANPAAAMATRWVRRTGFMNVFSLSSKRGTTVLLVGELRPSRHRELQRLERASNHLRHSDPACDRPSTYEQVSDFRRGARMNATAPQPLANFYPRRGVSRSLTVAVDASHLELDDEMKARRRHQSRSRRTFVGRWRRRVLGRVQGRRATRRVSSGHGKRRRCVVRLGPLREGPHPPRVACKRRSPRSSRSGRYAFVSFGEPWYSMRRRVASSVRLLPL